MGFSPSGIATPRVAGRMTPGGRPASVVGGVYDWQDGNDGMMVMDGEHGGGGGQMGGDNTSYRSIPHER